MKKCDLCLEEQKNELVKINFPYQIDDVEEVCSLCALSIKSIDRKLCVVLKKQQSHFIKRFIRRKKLKALKKQDKTSSIFGVMSLFTDMAKMQKIEEQLEKYER